MERDLKADSSYEDYQSGFSNQNFVMDMDNFADRKDINPNKDNSNRSTNGCCSTGQNPIYNYYFGSEQFENSSNCIQTPKKFEEKKEEEKLIPPSQNKLFNSPSLLIMEKIVGNESYALYQNLENYSFSIVRYTLKEVKDYSKYNQIIFRNNAYLNDVNPNKKRYPGTVNDIEKNFYFYMNYLAWIGTYVVFSAPSYWNINNINK